MVIQIQADFSYESIAMPIPWLVVLKSVPWTDVIVNAPKIADGAKRLWNSVSGKPAESPAARPVEAPREASRDDTATRLAALEDATAELHAQMLASSGLIRSLADQNNELVRHMEDQGARIKWLTRAVVVLGLAALAALMLALRG